MKFRLKNEEIKLRVTFLQCTCQLRLMTDRGDLMIIKPVKSQNQIKRNPRRNRVTRCVPISRSGCNNSGKFWWMMKFQYTETLTPVPLMKHLQSPCSREVSIWVSTVFALISLKTEIASSLKGPKLQEPHAEDASVELYFVLKFFGDLITAHHKVLSDNCESRNNHLFAIVVQDLATQWIQAYPCKSKTSKETKRSLQKFLEPDWKPKVIYTDNSLEFGKAFEDLSWIHCTST